jgi:hypothetical protein
VREQSYGLRGVGAPGDEVFGRRASCDSAALGESTGAGRNQKKPRQVATPEGRLRLDKLAPGVEFSDSS